MVNECRVDLMFTSEAGQPLFKSGHNSTVRWTRKVLSQLGLPLPKAKVDNIRWCTPTYLRLVWSGDASSGIARALSTAVQKAQDDSHRTVREEYGIVSINYIPPTPQESTQTDITGAVGKQTKQFPPGMLYSSRAPLSSYNPSDPKSLKAPPPSNTSSREDNLPSEVGGETSVTASTVPQQDEQLGLLKAGSNLALRTSQISKETSNHPTTHASITLPSTTSATHSWPHSTTGPSSLAVRPPSFSLPSYLTSTNREPLRPKTPLTGDERKLQLEREITLLKESLGQAKRDASEATERSLSLQKDLGSLNASLTLERQQHSSALSRMHANHIPREQHEALQRQFKEESHLRLTAESSLKQLKRRTREALDKFHVEADQRCADAVESAVAHEYSKWAHYVEQEHQRTSEAEQARDETHRLLDELVEENQRENRASGDDTPALLQDLSSELRTERERNTALIQAVTCLKGEALLQVRELKNELGLMFATFLHFQKSFVEDKTRLRTEVSSSWQHALHAFEQITIAEADCQRKLDAATLAIEEERRAHHLTQETLLRKITDTECQSNDAHLLLEDLRSKSKADLQEAADIAEQAHLDLEAAKLVANENMARMQEDKMQIHRRYELELSEQRASIAALSSVNEEVQRLRDQVQVQQDKLLKAEQAQQQAEVELARAREDVQAVRLEAQRALQSARQAEREADGERERCRNAEHSARLLTRKVDEAERERAIAQRVAFDLEQEMRSPTITPAIIAAMKDISRMSVEASLKRSGV